MSDELLTLKQIHAETGYSMATLYRLVERRELAVIRTSIGPNGKPTGAIRVVRRDWDAWVAQHRVAAKAETAPAIARAAATRSIADLPGAGRYTS